MKLRISLKRLVKEEKGVIAPLAAVFLTALIGFVGLAVDLGMFYTARTELQSAADAAALAGAMDMIIDSNGDNVAEANYDGAEATTKTYVESNKFNGALLTWTDGDDTFECGKWDFETDGFESLGGTDPEDLDTVRVTMSRVVDTYFSRIFGIDTFDIDVSAAAHMGCAGDGTQADIPVAVNPDCLTEPGVELKFNSENDECVQWTSFFDWPTNTPSVGQYIDDPSLIPPLSVGDTIFMSNGTMTPNLKDLDELFDEMKDDDGFWHVVMPVVEWDVPPVSGTVIGFVHYILVEVKDHGGEKGIYGMWADGGQLVTGGGSRSGGECFGVRASASSLMN